MLRRSKGGHQFAIPRYVCRPRSLSIVRHRTYPKGPTLFQNLDRTDEADAWAVLSHAWIGSECEGYLVAEERGSVLEVFCNRCGEVVRTFTGEEEPILDLTLPANEFCPQCHGALLPSFDENQGFVCRLCAKPLSSLEPR